ncbi:DNA translocase FtsK [Weissella diestrammenae]|uniref:DNA translocase FtsK n=2 Tax=Weissella diestrammenae TaxID=1162633 RepID=A0A7G9T7G9_9LACO|nr:DNA translocase FtsK [Weissella diestrammenae]MCM0582363.1 DNA translocase FtsK [Weissella diestrammenae]QNN76044.1 DNA translocase FtsK [Weissella diestrammenae]
MAATRKTAARKPSKKRTVSKSKQKQAEQKRLVLHTSGIIGLLIVITAIGQFGLVGKFLANLSRYFVGGTYQLGLILISYFLVGLAVYGQFPKPKLRHIIGTSLFYLGVILVSAIILFNQLDLHHDYIQTITKFINQDLNNHLVKTPVGGGVIGASILSVTYLATANLGSWLLAIVLLFAGIVVTFDLPIRALFVSLFGATEYAANVVQDKTREAVTTGAQKVTEINQNYKVRQNQITSELFEKDFAVNQPKSDAELTTSLSASEPESPAFVMPEIVAPEVTNEELMTTVAPGYEGEQRHVDLETGEILSSVQTVVAPPDDENVSHVDLIRNQEQYLETQHLETQHQPVTSTPELGVDINGFGRQIDDAQYVMPSVSLLTKTGSTDQTKEKNQLAEKSRILQQTLESFNIKATVEKVVLGPTITQYEIKPAVGVKVSKITNLSDDLAMALAAKSLRIEAPIPGKSLVGIEVANEQQAMVGFRNMFEQSGTDHEHVLKVPIGKSVTGEIVKMDLTKMPHLLIAGSTGSGKSVAINAILASILLQAKPSEVRLMLVDPKKVELSVYNDIPHLITPVVSEPRKAAAALKKVVAEMEKRFARLAEYGVRNIDGYNKMVETHNATNSDQLMKMPYLVAVVDELADLMMTVASEVEPAIVRIAQLGRAAGIHLIVATQRPSVDVITGLIKANVPSRIAFAVGSGVDSRTILDTNGAEKLLGRGDMLYKPIGANGGVRVQGAFLSDEDVEKLTDFVKNQGGAQYDESMAVTDDDLNAMTGNGDESTDSANALDEKWDEALDFAYAEGEVSASMMQRHFRIGYNRAARLVDDMEDQGVVGTAESGGKRRPVLMSKSQWYARQAAIKNVDQQY